MKYPAYAECKDSGIDWLGEVPEHWEVKRFKFPVRLINEKVDSIPMDVPYVGLENIQSWTGKLVETNGEDEKRAEGAGNLFADGDVLFGKLRPYLAKALLAQFSGACSPELLVFRGEDVESNYLVYYVLSEHFVKIIDSSTYGVKMPRASWDFIGNMPIAIPSIVEQQSIANFLDTKTSLIDDLIAKKEKQIELLKEKRTAIINRAVTKGLDPDVPMKDSGIDWLGEVPDHWEVLKGAFIGTLFGSEQVSEAQVTDEGSLPFIKVASLSLEGFEIESWTWYVDDSVVNNYKPRTGFITFPKRGAAIFTNKVNIVDRPALIDPNLMGWQIGSRTHTKFIAYLLKCRRISDLADISSVPQINNKHIAPEHFPVPPLEEQSEIVTFLDGETAKIDEMISLVNRQIEKLREYRQALISAAVTGKIDVRETVHAS